MGDSESIRSLSVLLEERSQQYGEAWKESGIWMSNMFFENDEVFEELLRTPYFYNWTIIFNKLFRILHDPYHEDSWLDIAGYAQLVAKDIPAKNIDTLRSIAHGTERNVSSE